MEEMNMSSTALGAEKAIIFISDAHEKFYYEKLKEVRYQDVYHKALVPAATTPAMSANGLQTPWRISLKTGSTRAAL